ncbi:MAG: translation initiation factor IF-2 [Rhodospirillales bacterium]|jgi:translation initiation factor IF-2|nr:translation initiation factor IF-2 [Rhodospirillales bacterium]
MSETKEQETDERARKKPLSLAQPEKLETKKTVEGGQVRQSFSHGRSKVVAVEVRRKRTYALDQSGESTEVREGGEATPASGAATVARAPAAAGAAAGAHLTTEEKAVRVRALEDAHRVSEQTRHDAQREAGEEAPETAPTAEELEAAAEVARRQAEEEETLRREEEEARRKAEDEEAHRREEQAKAAAALAAAKLKSLEGGEPEEAEERPRGKRPGRPGISARRGEPRRRSSKLTIASALSDADEKARSLASVRRAREKERLKLLRDADGEGQKIVRDVTIPEAILVQELANRMAERGSEVIKALMKMGVMATINQSIDGDTAEVVATEFGHNVKRVSEADVEIGLGRDDGEESSKQPRPPVVTVMGHVDHGKTSLLDALRETDQVSLEAGGITQHIGAYQVTLSSGGKITFIDTPGHEAFTDMRGRGAGITDIVVLVVAADDGVMPQTIEAIHHAKAANVPVIVAINKIDRPNADPGRVRTELLQHDIVVEEVGGETLNVEISAKERNNLDKLEEAILLQAEILDLKAAAEGATDGVIIESRMEQGRGSIATVLVRNGTLRVGDVLVAGRAWGRVRALMDAHGESADEAGPATPVEVQGLNDTPAAGDDFVVVDSEARARQVSEFRKRKERDTRAAASVRGTVDQMFDRIQEGGAQELPVVIKADAHGSTEAIEGALKGLETDEVKVDVLHAGVGGINEADVTLARSSNALVIGFGVRANRQARELARREDVEIRYYSVIYEIVDDLKGALSGMLAPALKEHSLGSAEILKVFSVSKVGKVAGCMVTEGTIQRGSRVRLLRDDVIVHEGELSQLKRFKDDAREVREGTECGVAFERFQDYREGDVIECYRVEELVRTL